MKAVYSPLHARHDGGVELYRGAMVPTFETPERAEIIRRRTPVPVTSDDVVPEHPVAVASESAGDADRV